MANPKRYRWVCPNCGSGKLIGKQPRKNKTARYCLPCSEGTGYLVERVCPALEKKRDASSEAAARRVAKKVEAERAKFHFDDGGVEPFDILGEFYRLQRFAPFRKLDWSRWSLKLRRCKKPQNRHGFCSPSRREISISLWEGLDRSDVKETLIHEMVHAVVRGQRTGPRWHGDKFRGTLDEASRKCFDIPADVTLPTYAGSTWGLDVAITTWLRENDPEYTARRAALKTRSNEAQKPTGGEPWVIEPREDGGLTLRITPGAHGAFYYGFCDWVSGDEHPEDEPRAPVAKAIHQAEKLPGRQGYLATLDSPEHVKVLVQECTSLLDRTSVRESRSEVSGLSRITHAAKQLEEGKLWSPREAKFSTRWGWATWQGGVTAPVSESDAS